MFVARSLRKMFEILVKEKKIIKNMPVLLYVLLGYFC